MKTTRHAVGMLVLTAALLPVAVCRADDVEITDYGDQIPTTEDLINALDPGQGQQIRSLSAPAKLRSVSLAIQFKYDSYELTEKARVVLNRLGGALISPRLENHTFLLEGHTDATGSAEYNQSLSEKRASTVKNYLVSLFGVESVRLKEVGLGETELMDESNPQSAVNRRVQIINLGQ